MHRKRRMEVLINSKGEIAQEFAAGVAIRMTVAEYLTHAGRRS